MWGEGGQEQFAVNASGLLDVATPAVAYDLVHAGITKGNGEHLRRHRCVEDGSDVSQNLISAWSSGDENSSR